MKARLTSDVEWRSLDMGKAFTWIVFRDVASVNRHKENSTVRRIKFMSLPFDCKETTSLKGGVEVKTKERKVTIDDDFIELELV